MNIISAFDLRLKERPEPRLFRIITYSNNAKAKIRITNPFRLKRKVAYDLEEDKPLRAQTKPIDLRTGSKEAKDKPDNYAHQIEKLGTG